MQKEAFFATERFIDLIKKWGTIDYEEYWNRSVIGRNYEAGHFKEKSLYGNAGTRYYCLSWSWVSMGTGGCLTQHNQTLTGASTPDDSISYNDQQQLYWQYYLQFIDYNADQNDDDWDANGNGSFIGDDDDLFLGQGPEVFTQGDDAWELYLINTSGDIRTYFRWKVQVDPNRPTNKTCNTTSLETEKGFDGEGCQWMLQILKLLGKDDNTDGQIDTWYIHPDFTSSNDEVKIDNNLDIDSHWQNIFSDNIHVSRAEFYLYPNKNGQYAWAETTENIQVSPYLQLRLRLQPSWLERKKIRGSLPEVDIQTTVQLSQIDMF